MASCSYYSILHLGPPHEANNNNSPESTLYLKYKRENGNHDH